MRRASLVFGPTNLHRVIGRTLTRTLVNLETVPYGRVDGAPVFLHPEMSSFGCGLDGISRPVTRSDYFSAQEEVFGPDALSEAVWGLKTRQPEDSAYWVLTSKQKAVFGALGIAFAAAAYLAPFSTIAMLVVALSALNLAVASFRLGLAWYAPEPTPTSGHEDHTPGPHSGLPRYTVMIPMYREAHVVPCLVASIGGLDYPHDRIEIFLVCEGDDDATLSAARKAAEHDARFRAIAVPACEPRTKPKALNYALCFARGELLVIYDAEDRPERDQLLKAARSFANAPAELACVQARLNWYNKDRNWLTRAFALEYALWFDYMLPGLQRMGAPIPLGGTSNHFKTEALIRCGAWDPFNVTEDADLGLRLMRLGGAVATLDSTTLEEATCSSRAWVRQRSRWIKGYMQTWLVQMRDPRRLWRIAGPSGFFGFQLFVGGVALTALANPLLWCLTAVSVAYWTANQPSPIPGFGAWWAAGSLLIGNLGLIYLNMLCALRRRWLDLIPAALMTPLYWILISLGGYKAFGQLIVNPFYWEKTEHGVGAAP